ncbi:MAG: hypothetical protein JKX98_04310 [Alcanivoracaceae bacterium]|nr:hypothetical protein [Alcanivoracaceae bacterium]
MKEIKSDIHNRSEVIRDTLVLQLKLIVDGVRDLLLMPLVLFATISGLLMHKNNPGRYLYRLLSYGKASEKWIGLFDEAEKDHMEPLDLRDKSFDELLKKTQNAFESKYVDESKKLKLLNKLNLALDEINTKINPEKKKT